MAAHDNINVTQFGGDAGNEYTAASGKTYTMHHVGSTGTEARTSSGRVAGRMSTFSGKEPEENTIHKMHVPESHQRQGIATAMLDYQRLQQPNLHHSATLTDEGRGFARATPREWQPTLTAGDYPGGLNDVSTANWKQYRSFDKVNKQSHQRWKNEQAEEAQTKKDAAYNAEHHEQLKLL